MVQKNVTPFRRKARPSPLARRRRRTFVFGPTQILLAAIVLSACGLAALYSLDSATPGAAAATRIVSVSWVDGDSGTINGQEFRLHDVDAPEGSPSRAGCAHERTLAERAKDAARRLTRGQPVEVRRSYGRDRYGRELVDLSIGGRDVAAALIASGHIRPWNFEAGESKPRWCG